MVKTGLLFFSLLAVLTNKCRSSSLYCPCDDALLFPGDNNQQYGISRGSTWSDPLTAFSACFWMNTPASYTETSLPTLISYATPENPNELYIGTSAGNLIVDRLGTGFFTPHDVTIADGTNHHVCLAWDLFAGNIKVYVDSKKIYEVNKKWTTSMPTNGTWIIGQYQLRFEDGFATDGSMKGMLAGVNIWGRILCRYEIVALASSCGPIIKGDVKSHNDFDTIGVVRFKPACCLSSC